MPQIIFSDLFNQDLQRITDFMNDVAPDKTSDMILAILDFVEALQDLPEMGFPAQEAGLSEFQHLRKLIIPFGRSAYLMLYHYDKTKDLIILLHIKHSKEKAFR